MKYVSNTNVASQTLAASQKRQDAQSDHVVFVCLPA